MTKDETLTVARIMTTAEECCPVCAADLLRQLVQLVPDAEVAATQAWQEQFPEEAGEAWKTR